MLAPPVEILRYNNRGEVLHTQALRKVKRTGTNVMLELETIITGIEVMTITDREPENLRRIWEEHRG